MGKFLNKRDYERFVQTLKGPLESLNGEIYEATSDTLDIFGCYLNIVIRETQVEPTIIFKLMTELAEKFKPMYDQYMDEHGSGMANTMVRIRNLIITGGLDGMIGININDSMNSVLPIQTLQWTKEVRTVKTIMTFIEDPVGFRSVMELDDTTLDRLNRSLKQLQSQKNVPHNLQVHLDFIEEGTFMLNDLEVKYKLPENIKLNYKCDARNHNKITGVLDFDFMPIYVEYPINPVSGKNIYDTLKELLTDKFSSIFKSNDLVPDRYSSNSNKSQYNFKIKFTG
jgi:hypothetical protein